MRRRRKFSLGTGISARRKTDSKTLPAAVRGRRCWPDPPQIG
jgi:hypothetical protein